MPGDKRKLYTKIVREKVDNVKIIDHMIMVLVMWHGTEPLKIEM